MREATATKTYPALRTFIHEAYGWCLTAMALRSMSRENGYAPQTIYNMMEGHADDTNDDTLTTITKMAAARTTTTEIAAAINQLSVKQTTIMSQMV